MISAACANLFMRDIMLERMLQAFEAAKPLYLIKHMSWDET